MNCGHLAGALGWFVSLLVISYGLPVTVSAQDALHIALAVRTSEPPVIDGQVEEDVWMSANVLSDFVQAEPFEGRPATEKTEVRILYDDDAVYFGVICYDSEPSGIVVTDARRDASLVETDSFQIILDTYHDRQNGFVFGTNPAGIEHDGQVTNEGEGGQGGPGGVGQRRSQTGSGGGFNLNWDAAWEVRTLVNDIGWMAEFAIPLRSLRYGGDAPQVWGLNFQRNIRRKREEVYWSPVARIYDLYRLSSAGELHGLELATPRNFKVTPYALGDASRDYENQDEIVATGDWGVDAKFGITPSLNLDLTYNTDFAQVEVDEQQINLTRFNLFFPEKRPFFLENAGLFSYGKARDIELFFSRRIGLDEDGGIVPILAGARLSGKAGNYNVGFLNMQTEEVTGVTPANNFTVATLSREFRNRSSLGGVFVNRAATGAGAGNGNWNRTWGVEGKLGIGPYLDVNGFAARTETPGATGREHAANLRAEYQRRAGRVWAEYTEVGDDFNPEVGFLQRDDFRNLNTGWFLNIRPRRQEAWLREVRPHITYDGFWDFTGFKTTERLHIDSHVELQDGAFFSPAVNRTVEGLHVPFEIVPGVVVPPGTYQNWELAWRWNTDPSVWISYEGRWDHGGFLSGSQNIISSTVTLRRGSELSSSLSWTYSAIDLAEGSFVTNLGQIRFNYSFTPQMYVQALIQYNDLADIWSTNLRFSWLHTAGTGLFIVYNDTEGLGDTLMGPQNRSLIIKYARQFDILK